MRTIVGQFCVKVWRRVVVADGAASIFNFVLDYLLVMVWIILSSLVWCAILRERCVTLCLYI